MRASDDTHYNIKRLHVVFAVSSLALLAVTIWMLVADHQREWKVYQRTYRDAIEPWLTETRLTAEQGERFAEEEKQLEAALEQARAAVPERALIERFCAEIRREAAERQAAKPDLTRLDEAYDALKETPSVEARHALTVRLNAQLADADLRRDNDERRLRFRRADFEEARSTFEAAVGEGMPQERLDRLQARVGQIQEDVDTAAVATEDATKHAGTLRAILGEVTRGEREAAKALTEHRASVDQLHRTLLQQRPNLAKSLLRSPVIEAFGRPLAVEQIWLPELTIDYNFRDVARFDRCVTCHQATGKTQPGSATEPALTAERVMTVHVPLGDGEEDEEEQSGGTEADVAATLPGAVGLALAARGMIDAEAVTIAQVLPKTPAAEAKLMPGDVILKVNDDPVVDRADAVAKLLEAAKPPEASDEDDADEEEDEPASPRTIALEIRRGLPHPFQSHPRLDLFVGSMSPHPMAEFGCTICHDGQGSATAFKFASHTPNDPATRKRWRHDYGWFRNHHWDFPMLPNRFAESRCLKCHHDVTDLEPSERFRDPPAPKLLAGYHLVRQNGCFGCHEIKGTTATGERVGPDMRLEPNRAATALQLLTDSALTDEQRLLARRVAEQSDDAGARRELIESLRSEETVAQLRRNSVAMVELLASEPKTPGTMRKAGPSLREKAGRMDEAVLAGWIGNPTGLRPATRMPHFYGMHEHLDGKSLEDARRYEAVELRATAEWLAAVAQPVEPLPPPSGVTEAPSAERGKPLFQTQGCLACHKHDDFSQGQGTQGPNLTRLGSKYTTEDVAAWLADWIRDPSRHAPRTLMPNSLLEPVPLTGQGGADKPKVTDPVADIAAYLLSSTGWTPEPLPPLVEADLNELALLHLATTFPRKQAQQYLAEGIPETMAEGVSGDAVELLGPISREKKLHYVARRTIAKRGCYGCHDIPGFEAAQGIGPALSDWGRKETSLLAFGQVHQFLAKSESKTEQDGFYKEAILEQRREGFLWQKLDAPRSFDYKAAQNKGYNERLTMGKFALADDEREAVTTFVLGLIAEPPVAKYVHKPDARRKAIVEGRKVLDKYACAECHTLEMERWQFEFDPDEFEVPEAGEDFAFLKPRFTAEQIAASMRTDQRGRAHAEVVGMPQVGPEGRTIVLEGDEEDAKGKPLPMTAFSLWEPAVVNGEVCPVGGADLLIYDYQVTRKRPPLGGAFARLLYPVSLAGANVAGMEAWGWGPPPLVHEGEQVQPAWLHNYLLDPQPIRPAVVLRMPKYTLSADEAGKLVDYFAARANVAFPYHSDPRSRSSNLAAKEQRRPHRMDDAMRIAIDRKTYCAKCHLVGDFDPGGETKTILAPNLDTVGRRVRPEYVRRWLANPKAALPYTGMPVNFPPTGDPLGQDLFKGDSLEQLDAVVDLLLDYDRYLLDRASIRKMMESK